MRLKDRVAVVTGAAAGIGRATAELFAAEGARIALVDVDGPGVRAAADAIAAAGRSARAYPADVADFAAARDAVADVVGAWGGVDILVASAGISIGKTLTETSEEEWDRVFAVNVKGTFVWCHVVLPHMVRAGKGAIVTLSSQLAVKGARRNAAYSTSKAAVVGLTRSIAIDYGEHWIRANAVLPGAILTPMQERFLARQPDPDAARRRSTESRPLKRFGTSDEVAHAILFLASDESSFTTGTVLAVEGGWLSL